jgi:hypothetical protein
MDPYVRASRHLARAGVRHLIIGAFGVNLYARDAGQIITTADCDLLIPARLSALAKALKTLRRLGFKLEAGGEPLPTLDPVIVHGILRSRANVRAFRKGAQIDLALRIAGGTFGRFWKNRRTFVVEGVRLQVGSLADLIRSKQAAGRPKDRLFLGVFRSVLKDMLRRESGPRGK